MPLDARIIWVSGDQVYLAALDSVTLDPGSLLTFIDPGRTAGAPLAVAAVTGVLEAKIIGARITSGSLESVEGSRKLEVLASPPPRSRVSMLRVGYPSSKRAHPFSRCTSVSVRGGSYHTDSLGERSFRLVRDTTAVTGLAMPDTLLVRLYDEVADQEIALERGEIDAALFWPGEASHHIREAMPLARRSIPAPRGIIAVEAGDTRRGDSLRIDPATSSLLDSLNRELFRGDLVRIRSKGVGVGGADPTEASGAVRTRFEVDRSIPAREGMERFLNRGRRVSSNPRDRLRLVYLDRPPTDAESPQPESWVFAMGVPVITGPGVRAYLDPLVLEGLVDLIDCRTAARRP